jgi:hypothetical protein
MSNRKSELIRTNMFLSADERDGLKKLAHKRKVSAAALVRQVLDAFLGIPAALPEPVVSKSKPPAL